MGYCRSFKGLLQVKRRKLVFNLNFFADKNTDNHENEENAEDYDQDIDLRVSQFNLENVNHHLFEIILSFAFLMNHYQH